MTGIAQQACPAFFLRLWLAAHMLHDGSIAPERPRVGEIVERMAAQPEPLRLNDRNVESTGHLSSLRCDPGFLSGIRFPQVCSATAFVITLKEE
jgi:hypothetical protein